MNENCYITCTEAGVVTGREALFWRDNDAWIQMKPECYEPNCCKPQFETDKRDAEAWEHQFLPRKRRDCDE